MASNTDQGRRTRTLPIQTHEAPREVLTGEIVEDEAPTTPEGAGQRSQARTRSRRNRTSRRSTGPAGTTPIIERHQPPMDPAARLRREVDAAGRRYMETVRKSDILAPGKTPKQRSSQLTGVHKGYVSMMVLSCLQPLSEQISAKSILSVVGMGSALWALSPNFRLQMGEFRDKMQEAVSAKIEGRRQSQMDQASAKLQSGDQLSEKWRAKLERVSRGGRDPFTANSAAMTEVALTENAYAAMRQEGADVEGIRFEHEELLKTLYQHAHEDGVGAEEVAAAARVVVGLRLNDEPELASVFQGLAHGQFAKSDPREVRIAGTEDTAWVWTGEFESRLGQQVESGSFELRGPMTPEQHQAAMADTMTADMVSLIRRQGADGLNVGVVSYAAAWGLKDRPEFEDMLAMDNPLGERLLTSQRMLDTMSADGITSSEQQQVYSNAYVDAMQYVGTLYPEVEQEWGEKFGGNWREAMRDFVSNPQSYMDDRSEWDQEQAQEGTAAREAGPARPSAKYRNSRINQNYIETAKTGMTGFGSDPSDFRDPDFDMGG